MRFLAPVVSRSHLHPSFPHYHKMYHLGVASALSWRRQVSVNLTYTSYSLTIMDCVISALSRSHSALLKIPLIWALMPYTLSSVVIICLSRCLSSLPQRRGSILAVGSSHSHVIFPSTVTYISMAVLCCAELTASWKPCIVSCLFI
jgi:hypothetical protein